jgi:predicted amidohydrolase
LKKSPTVKTLIACGQFAPAPGDIKRNLDSIRLKAGEAAGRGARILVLPELCLCGYPSAADARSRAVTMDGPEMQIVRECARTAGIALCLGLAELASEGRLFNSMAYIDAEGALRSVYRKVHLWVDEKPWAVPGDSFESFDAEGLRLGIWICYDTRFPESARRLARSGATLGLVGSAWFGPEEEWELAVRARAMDNGMYVAAAAVQGAFDAIPFHGASLIVDPHGTVVAHARRDRDDLIIAEHDDEAVRKFRSRLPLLDDLRPGAYG